MFVKGEILFHISFRGNIQIVEFIKYDNEEKDSFTAEILFSNKYPFEKNTVRDNFITEAFSKADSTNIPSEYLTQELIELIKERNISIINKLLENKINLSNLDYDKRYETILNVYEEILKYIYGENSTIVDYKMNDFSVDLPPVNTNNNKDILKVIRDDILNEIKKEIDYLIGEYY